MTLITSAAKRGAAVRHAAAAFAAVINIRPQQQPYIHCCNRWDGQTDGQTPYCYIDLNAYHQSSVNTNTRISLVAICHTNLNFSHNFLPLVFLEQTFGNIWYGFSNGLQCFDAVGWAAGRASGL